MNFKFLQFLKSIYYIKKKIINNIYYYRKEDKNMKFTKGLMWGSIITAGMMMIASEGVDNSKKKIIKKGKHWMRKIGM